MKKRLTIIALVLVCALALSACGCKHENWTDANCETPKTCADCGATEGEALGHSWTDADCETAKTCANCGKTEGEALGHSWTDADCENPKTCANCDLTEGEALGHTWIDATTEAPKTCEVCGATEGDPITTDPRFTTESTAAIQGKWVATMELTGEMMGEPGFDGAIVMGFTMELRNDGTMAMSVELVDASAMRDYLLDALYAEFEAQGLDKAAADAAMKQSTGMTVEEYADFALGMLDFSAMMGDAAMEGVYYVADGKLYSGDSWNSEMTGESFTLEGDTLTLVTDMEGESMEMVFTRAE